MQSNGEQGRNICILLEIHHIVVVSFLVEQHMQVYNVCFAMGLFTKDKGIEADLHREEVSKQRFLTDHVA
jgi:hypothetical protein